MTAWTGFWAYESLLTASRVLCGLHVDLIGDAIIHISPVLLLKRRLQGCQLHLLPQAMALRIPAVLFLAVLAGTGNARRVRAGDGDEVLQDQDAEGKCKGVLKPQYCPVFEHNHWLIDSMVGKEPAFWECMIEYAEKGDEQCQKVREVLTAEMASYRGGHNTVDAKKLTTFREILGLEAMELQTPALSDTKPWEKERAEKAKIVDVPAVEPTVTVEPSSGGCWCPAITRSEAHIGGFEKKRKQDLFGYDAETKLGLPCGGDCTKCYNAVKAAVVGCCESDAEGNADSTQCAKRWAPPAWEEATCMCGGLANKKSALWEKQSVKTCWPNTPCYPKKGVSGSCCPAV